MTSVAAGGPIALALGLVMLVGAPSPTRQTTGGQLPRLVIESTDGRDLFSFYCATCHGRDGTGNGPVAPALKTKPTDLTQLARLHGGTFPADQVRATLEGRSPAALPAHGTADMPVWGPIFRALDPDDQQVEIRILSLVAHLKSLQAR